MYFCLYVQVTFFNNFQVNNDNNNDDDDNDSAEMDQQINKTHFSEEMETRTSVLQTNWQTDRIMFKNDPIGVNHLESVWPDWPNNLVTLPLNI